MAQIGQRHRLRVTRDAPPGLYVDGENLGEILLPGRYIPPGTRPGDFLDLFLYRDSEDRLVATTETPLACVGEFASLRVVSVHPQIGTFLDWGLPKDLLLPIREQRKPPRLGDSLVVYLLHDIKSDRLIATTRFDKYLSSQPPAFAAGASVTVLVAEHTPLGCKVVVEGAYAGLLYRTDLPSLPAEGSRMTCYVTAVRPDGKIDLRPDPAGYQRVGSLADQILAALKESDGRLPLHDKSSPEEIRDRFQTSKKAFKQAIGDLYKKRRIRLTPQGIELI